MQKLFIDRKASDNKYLHKDFHVAFDRGLTYLALKYGGAAADEYLAGFTVNHYAPLIENIKSNGLAALANHLTGVYAAEEAPRDLFITETEDALTVSVLKCPAVSYMRGIGYEPSEWFYKSASVVYKTIADETGYGFEMVSYDRATGAAKFRFYKNQGGIK